MPMPVLFPNNLPKDVNRIRGAANMYICEYLAAAADPTATQVHYLGQVAEGGFTASFAPERAEINGEEAYAPDGDILTKEQTIIKCVLQESPIEMLALLLGSGVGITGNAPSIMTADDVVADAANTPDIKTLGYGGMQLLGTKIPTPYYQIILQCPNEALASVSPSWNIMNFKGYYQIWQALVSLAGDIKITKGEIASMPIEVKARWDWSVTPGLTATRSTGRLWRRTIVTSNS